MRQRKNKDLKEIVKTINTISPTRNVTLFFIYNFLQKVIAFDSR